jgi:hypothetical protein
MQGYLEGQELPLNVNVSAFAIISKGLEEDVASAKKKPPVLQLKKAKFELGVNDKSKANSNEIFSFLRHEIDLATMNSVQPQFWNGPIDRQMVLYSLQKDWTYGPVHNDLLTCAKVDVEEDRSVIATKSDDSSFVFSRLGEKGFDSHGWAFLNLIADGVKDSGFNVEQRNLWIECEVSAENLVDRMLQFHIQPATGGTDFKYLSSAWNETQQLTIEGQHVRVYLPIDQVDVDDRLAQVSIGAVAVDNNLPQAEKNAELDKSWNAKSSIRMHSLRIVTDKDVPKKRPMIVDSKQEQLAKHDVEPPVDILAQWWSDYILRSNNKIVVTKTVSPHKKSVHHHVKLNNAILNKAFIGGIEGPLEPPEYIDKERCILSLSIGREVGPTDDKNPKIGVVVYSGSKVLGQWEMTFDQKGEIAAELSFADSGIARSLSVGLSGCDQITVKEMRLVFKAPKKQILTNKKLD